MTLVAIVWSTQIRAKLPRPPGQVIAALVFAALQPATALTLGCGDCRLQNVKSGALRINKRGRSSARGRRCVTGAPRVLVRVGCVA